MPGPGPGFGGPPPGFGGPPPRFNPNAHYHFHPTPSPLGGYVSDGDDAWISTISKMWTNTVFTFKQAIQRKGIIRGIPLAMRRMTSGQLRAHSLEGKLAVYDKQFSEHRITERQCKKRKMDAAKKFNRYLLRTGYYTINEYNYYMQEFAQSIGVNYINDVHTQGRTR